MRTNLHRIRKFLFVCLTALLVSFLFQNCSNAIHMNSLTGFERAAPTATATETGDAEPPTPATPSAETATPTPTPPTSTPVACSPTRHYQKQLAGQVRIHCGSAYVDLPSPVTLVDRGEVLVKLSFQLTHDGSATTARTGMVRLIPGDVSQKSSLGEPFFSNVGYGALCSQASGQYQTFAYGKLTSQNQTIKIASVAYGTQDCAGAGNASPLILHSMVLDAWVEDENCTQADKAIRAWSYHNESRAAGVDRPVYLQTSSTAVLTKSLTLPKSASLIAFGQNFATRTPSANASFGAVLCGQQYDTAASALTVAGAQSVHADAFSPSAGQSHVMLSNSLAVNAAAGTHTLFLSAAVNQTISVGYTETGILNSGDSNLGVIKGPFTSQPW